MDELKKLIIEQFGIIFWISIIVVIAIGAAIWWARGVWEKSKKVDQLPCQKHEDMLTTQVDKHHSLNNTITRIDTSITYMQKTLDSLSQNMSKSAFASDPFTQTKSPLAITEKGQAMVQEIGLNEMIDRNWKEIKAMIDADEMSVNPYDIQQFCIRQAVVFPEKFVDGKSLDAIKIHAYSTGNELQSYMRVIAVIVRDRYFKEMNINVDDVDKYDPNFQ